jgi:predicted ABC-type ATPase
VHHGRPQRSGKSSAYAKLQLEGVWINADEIAKGLTGTSDGGSAAMAAGRAAIRKIAEMIETRQSFIFETTPSSQQSLNLMCDAKAAGFTVDLYYTALDSVETNGNPPVFNGGITKHLAGEAPRRGWRPRHSRRRHLQAIQGIPG